MGGTPNIDEGKYGSRAARVLFFCLGCLFVGLGTIGVVLPLIPTTPFLLLAAACYARSSRRFYDWLLANRVFGPTIRQWQETRSVAQKTKVVAIVMLVLTLGSSVIFFVPLWPVKVLLVAIGLWAVMSPPARPEPDSGYRHRSQPSHAAAPPPVTGR